jgi:hypothetical protein
MIDPNQVHVNDIVHLNSGSPALEIIAFSSDERHVAVKWEENQEKTSYAVFPIECVRV